MKIKKISETEMIITKNAWRKRLVGLTMTSILFFLPFIYKITVDHLPDDAQGYSVVTAGLLGLIGIGLVLFSHNIKIHLRKGGNVEIGRRTLFGKTKKEVVPVNNILSLQVVRGSSTSLSFIMKDNSPAVRFFSQENRTFLGLGGGSDLDSESHQIAEFLGVPLTIKGIVQNTDLAAQSTAIATEVLRPDTLKMEAATEDRWEEQKLGKYSAHQRMADREVRRDIVSSVLNPQAQNTQETTGEMNQPQSNSYQSETQVGNIIERVIEKPSSRE